MKKNYRLTFMLLFIAFGAVVVITASMVTYRVESGTAREDFLAQAQSVIAIKHDQFEKFFNRPGDALALLASDSGSLDYFAGRSRQTFMKLAALLLGSNPDIMRLLLTHAADGSVETLHYDRDAKALVASSGGPAASRETVTDPSPFLRREEDAFGTTFSINAPVFKEERYLGMITALLDFSKVAALFESSPAGFIHLCDDAGGFLVYNDRLLPPHATQNLYDIFPETAEDILFSDIYVGSGIYGRQLFLGGERGYMLFMQMNEAVLSEKKEKMATLTLYLILGVLLFSLPVAYLFALVPKRLNDEIVEKNALLEELNTTLHTRIHDAIKANRHKDRIMFNQSKNAAMGEMIAMITHQWRQPLSSIAALASRVGLEARLERTEPQAVEAQMQQIITASRYLSQTIEDFKNFFKPDTEKRETTLDEVIDEALKFSEHPLSLARIEVQRTLRGGDETVWLYKNELIQVLMNLIKNSIDQIREKGIEPGRITIESTVEARRAIITVTDNAGGIDAAILPHIFDEYTTQKAEGTGLGLYMSRMIMLQRMNGNIEAENVVLENGEKGARFTLTFPL